MVKLPNYQNAVVPDAKITAYLLSPTHRDGRHKAAFFNDFGFTKQNWQELATACFSMPPIMMSPKKRIRRSANAT